MALYSTDKEFCMYDSHNLMTYSTNYGVMRRCTKCSYYEEEAFIGRLTPVPIERVYGKPKSEPIMDAKEIRNTPTYNYQADTVCGVPIENIERGKMKYSDVLAAELQRVLLKEEKRFSDFGEEPKGLRSVVIFDIQFTERGKWYNYAAIRCGDGKWYTTGTKRAAGYTWDELLDFIEDVHKYRKFKVVYAPKVK